jgi:NAD(P)-dependent dehydrogenase (short-subunit alcohol dehydrogenase family)
MSKSIVITGSTRGIGYGLADAFLARGCRVMISGRQQPVVDQAAAALAQKHAAERVAGHACEVSVYSQIQALWDAAQTRFGRVDIWINNAGIANLLTPFWELDPGHVEAVVKTNVLGTMYGCQVALREMLAQGGGALYNMEGFGSRGSRKQPGLALYGATKAAMAFLDDSLLKELEGKPVIIGTLSPGMVVTDLLLDQRKGENPADWEQTRRIINILADRVEIVTPWIAGRILENEKTGARINWLSGSKVLWRFLTARLVKRNVFDG